MRAAARRLGAAATTTAAAAAVAYGSAAAASAAAAAPPPSRGRSLADIEPAPAAWDAAAKRDKRYSVLHPNLVVLDSRAITALFTTLRDENTVHLDFALAADRLMRILSEEGLANLSGVTPKTVRTPCGVYTGLALPPASEICAVSIVRAGDTLLEALRRVAPAVSVGKILIQRDETTLAKTPKLFYVKLPANIREHAVILVDPMLATGQSAGLALSELVKRGVCPERVLFLNVVSCPEGLAYLAKHWPAVKVVTAAVDDGLDERMYIVPGLGDFGDRYCDT